MKTSDLHYSSIPALAQYIDRIEAKQLNFRTFMVQEFKGKYYVERTMVRVLPDGSIYCSTKEHEPTQQETDQIRGALMALEFPKSTPATEAQFKKLRDKLKGTQVYPMWTRGKVPLVAMAQQRVEREDGKHYIPWTMWSDGEWRAMEPDGKLPFYKPKVKKSNRIMIHEGAKAAEGAAAAALDPKHPWSEFLARFDHWGILGGALAPHRADYSELMREQAVEVVYVCDRDFPGESALEVVSKNWAQPLRGIKFDDSFPTSFDLADPLPEVHFREDGTYRGPKIEDLVRPATWATEIYEDEDGKKGVRLLPHFKEEWSHTISPEFFIHKNWPLKMFDDDGFRSLVRPFSHRCDIADLVRSSDAKKVEQIDYRPDLEPGIYTVGKKRIINTCAPRAIDPVKGDYSPFIKYVEQLVPLPVDQLELMRWCATLIARPEIRMTYSVLLVSEAQGIGKTTLGEKILAPIIGMGNCSFPSEKDICDNQFNGWLAHKRLVVVNEIYAGSSAKAYNQLKSVVADAQVEVNRKFVDPYVVQNWAHVMASSNSMRALRIDPDDRRWLVPGLTEQRLPHKFWVAFNNWLTNEEGLGKVVYWAEEFLKKNAPVKNGEHSPDTHAKRSVIEEGFSPGMLAVMDLLNTMKAKDPDGKFVVLDTDLVEYIKQKVYQGRDTNHLERPATVRKVAKQIGWYCGNKNDGCVDWSLPKGRSRVLSPTKELAELSPPKLVKMQTNRVKPLELLAF